MSKNHDYFEAYEHRRNQLEISRAEQAPDTPLRMVLTDRGQREADKHKDCASVMLVMLLAGSALLAVAVRLVGLLVHL